LSVIYLASCTVLEYYNQTTTLFEKSKSLALAALVLALSAFAMQTLLSAALRKGVLSIPDDLAEFCRRVPGAGGWKPSGEVLLRALLAAVLAIFMGLFVRSVQQKEILLSDGKPITLQLTPRDPRSLMQGDYMVLNLMLEDMIENALGKARDGRNNSFSGASRVGVAIIEPDARGVYQFVSLYDDALPLGEKQAKIVYRSSGYDVRVGSGSFFFREGMGRAFEAARYADLRIDEKGQCLITGLRNEALEIIDPVKR
ncbi:MAG: GDYXXLXY domain-containing protein, partial [Candidatus Accumulibacter sp.]|nr:GDYXXLXY domain-containing protein [Accumulibacter sp.]